MELLSLGFVGWSVCVYWWLMNVMDTLNVISVVNDCCSLLYRFYLYAWVSPSFIHSSFNLLRENAAIMGLCGKPRSGCTILVVVQT